MIIDAHAHVGVCGVFGASQTGQQLVAVMDSEDIERSITQPFPGAEDVRAAHDEIAGLAEATAGRVIGLASVNPHIGDQTYREITRHYVEQRGFVALKLHTIGHAVSPRTEAAKLVFATAADLGVPVMIHTGPGVPFADPIAWAPAAKEYHETPVVLAHAGASLFTEGAIVAAEMCENIHLETSWCNPQDIRRAVQRLGAERVLFGSDMIFNVAPELKKYESIGLRPTETPELFSENAIRVFGLK